MDQANLLVSSSPRAPGRARREILARLRALGDPIPEVAPTGVPGISCAKTSLDPRRVVGELRALCVRSPHVFRVTSKWVPVDLWVGTDLESMKQGVARLGQGIQPGETWRMTLERRTENRRDAREVIFGLASLISAKVDLAHPDKILLVEIFDDRVALAVLTPSEVFSVVRARPPGQEAGAGSDDEHEAMATSPNEPTAP
jgi:tRNA(Ser,Leu) C12 N-acetylase TAN1